MTSPIKNKSMIFFRLGMAVLLGSLWLGAAAVWAEDWPQFRGPNRDGIWSETGLLKSFPPDGLKISWRVPVGRGWSSPIVAQGRVYLTDADKPAASVLWPETRAVSKRILSNTLRFIRRPHILDPPLDLGQRTLL